MSLEKKLEDLNKEIEKYNKRNMRISIMLIIFFSLVIVFDVSYIIIKYVLKG